MDMMQIINYFGGIIGALGIVTAVLIYILSSKKQKEISGQLTVSLTKQKDIRNSLETLREKYHELENERPAIEVHNVIMDGMSLSGKTTFIARLLNPATTEEQLKNLDSTVVNYVTPEVPICFERSNKSKNRLLHMLRFHDISGEKAFTFMDAIDDLLTKDSEEASAILLIIWDISKDYVKKNIEYLNKRRIEVTYGNKKARRIIKSVIVFFNKVDKIKNLDVRERRVKKEKQKIEEIFEDLFEVGYGEIKFYSGSAFEGTGVLSCYGELIKNFGLEHNFFEIRGNQP